MRGVALLSFLLTLAFTPLAIWALRKLRVIDVPSARSSHVVQTPRGGGTGVFLGAVSGVFLAGAAGVAETWSLTTLLVCSSFFAIVGLIDDMKTLNVKPRLAAQLACALVFVAPWFYLNGPFTGTVVRGAMALVAVVWVMGYLNAFNFMDGINGISSLHAILAGTTYWWLGHEQQVRIVQICGVAIAGAAAGFLPYNFPRARVFLGDVGSYFIGTWIAISALIALVWGSPAEAVFAPLCIYLADTAYTLIDRIRRGENWRESHHEHVYQRLIDRGWSHPRTAFLVVGFSAACTALGLVSLRGVTIERVLAAGAIVLVMAVYVALPTLLDRRADVPARIGTPHDVKT